MTIYLWKFNTIPDPQDVESFIDAQMPLFSRNARYLTGGDGEPIVDLMRVEHNCGAVNLEFQLNGVEGQNGDVFCFPGYYPGDMDDQGNPLFNYCDTRGHFYGKIIGKILDRAQQAFDMEVMISVEKQRQLHSAW
ncbi:MAG TPA: hypothetical protein VK880_03100 [Anaerolineales bacterium]|nr:hypothetical protein [Anaerolineales bacterium]